WLIFRQKTHEGLTDQNFRLASCDSVEFSFDWDDRQTSILSRKISTNQIMNDTFPIDIRVPPLDTNRQQMKQARM
ncbi:hypothetical protein OAB11_03215, partial [Verrucomicrobia bacterium]|nr:hypothetical protein [Verrucomicrobiota bacterium]